MSLPPPYAVSVATGYVHIEKPLPEQVPPSAGEQHFKGGRTFASTAATVGWMVCICNRCRLCDCLPIVRFPTSRTARWPAGLRCSKRSSRWMTLPFADASVRFFIDQTDADIIAALGARNDGHPLQADFDRERGPARLLNLSAKKAVGTRGFSGHCECCDLGFSINWAGCVPVKE